LGFFAITVCPFDIDCQEWVFSKKFIIEHKETKQVLSPIFKYTFMIKEMTLVELESIDGYHQLSEKERRDLEERCKLLSKRPKKIIIHRE
jgi:hypothetical protein